MAILTIRTEKIVRNFTLLKSLCDARGLELVTVVKCCLGEDGILRKLVERGAHIIAETSPANLARFEGDVKRMLLRSSLSDIRSGLPNCDYVLVSELPLLHALSELPASRRPAAILTLEFGDLREGIPPDQLPEFLHDATRIKGARIVGFAATFGCLLGKLPDADTIARLRQLMNRLAEDQGFRPEIVSLGGTAVFDLLDEGSDRGGITQLRIGEALFFGYNMSAGKALPGFERDAFAFYGEIIEVKEKDVSFSGSFGFNAFGTRVPLNGSGRRIRAVLDFGELAAPISCLKPAAEGVSLVGSTHDFAVADITECGRRPRVGDVLEFATNYTGASCAMLNPSVRKTIL